MEAENIQSQDTDTVVTIEQVIELMDKNYALAYVDYRDDLDGRMEEIQKFIHGEEDALLGIEDGWEENRGEAVDEIIKNLQAEMESDRSLEDGELDDAFIELSDEIRDAIYERDDSNIIKDLIRNTSGPVMFFDTGVEMEGYDGDLDEQIAQIKETLHIPADDTQHDARISMMVQQASYGGLLVVYFRGDLSEWINWEGVEYNTITFSGNVSIAIVNHWNGSGDSTEIKHTFSLPYNKENVFIDKTIKYNFTYAVCGMSSDWCEDTVMVRSVVEEATPAERSSVNTHLDKEAKYNATFAAGKCTAGDMDMNRHRNTYYRNDYPCGTKCPDCGTFWID